MQTVSQKINENKNLGMEKSGQKECCEAQNPFK